MRFLVPLLIFLALPCFVLASPEIAGTYQREDQTIVHDDSSAGTTPYLAVSCLKITKGPKGGIKFTAFLEGANAHVCEIASEDETGLSARPVEGGYEYRGEQFEDGEACVLGVMIERDKITLQDKNLKCSKEFACGARIGIEGLSFPRSSLSRQNKPCPGSTR